MAHQEREDKLYSFTTSHLSPDSLLRPQDLYPNAIAKYRPDDSHKKISHRAASSTPSRNCHIRTPQPSPSLPNPDLTSSSPPCPVPLHKAETPITQHLPAPTYPPLLIPHIAALTNQPLNPPRLGPLHALARVVRPMAAGRMPLPLLLFRFTVGDAGREMYRFLFGRMGRAAFAARTGS